MAALDPSLPLPAPRPGVAGRRGAGRRPGGVYAAIDLGTNNCRMLVGRLGGGQDRDGVHVIDSVSRVVRLGEGLQATGRLGEASMARARDALRLCAARLDGRPVRGVRAVATEACRRATNGPGFVAAMRAETGLPITIISAREEAQLALESCTPLLVGGSRRALLVDIGGGSTEVAWVRLDEGEPALVGTISLPLGVVTFAERFGAAAFEHAGFEAMVDDVSARLLGFERVHCIAHEIRLGGVRLLGTSGAVTTLAGVAIDLPRYQRLLIDGTVLHRDTVDRAMRQVRASGAAGLAAHPCIGPDRAAYVLPGCAIFEAIRRLWPAEEVVVADRGLREGMLHRLTQRDRAARVR